MEELARRGNDVVVVARNQSQLEELAASVERRHSVSAEVLPADLTSLVDLERVATRIRGGERIDMVVNNAGRGSHGPFADSELDDQLGQLDLNIGALVALSHAALSVMVPRGSGSLLNVASVAAFQPVPNEAVYSAAKSFVLSFTEALHEEVKASAAGVHVTVLCPGFTRSEFQDRAGIDAGKLPAFVWQEAADVVTAGLDGLAAGKALVVSGAFTKFLTAASSAGPRSLVRSLSGAASRRFG